VNIYDTSEAYQHLRLLESPILAKRLLVHREDPDATSHSFTLSSYISQARHFLQCAESSDLRVRPLLLYYGLLQLAKATILVYLPHQDHTLESQKHGLSIPRLKKQTHYWKNNIWVQHHGVFGDWLLAQATAEGIQDSISSLEKLPISVSQLWACIPEAAPILSVLGIQSRTTCIQAAQINSNQHITLTVDRRWASQCKLTMDECAKFAHDVYTQQAPESNLEIHWLSSSEINCPQIDVNNQMDASILAHHPWANLKRQHSVYWSIPPLPSARLSSTALAEPFIHFMLLFQASMLARYDAEQWSELLCDEMTPEALLIELLCSLANKLLPVYFANQLHIPL